MRDGFVFVILVLNIVEILTDEREECGITYGGSALYCYHGYHCCGASSSVCCHDRHICAGQSCIHQAVIIIPCIIAVGVVIFIVVCCIKKYRNMRTTTEKPQVFVQNNSNDFDLRQHSENSDHSIIKQHSTATNKEDCTAGNFVNSVRL